MGVPPDELMASLFEAIVMQNLSRADARQHAAARGAAAGRPQLLHQGHARLLEGQHPQDLGRARHAAARRRSARRPDQDSRQRAVFRRDRQRGVRQDRRRQRRHVHRLRQARVVRQRRPRGREGQARRRRADLAKDDAELADVQGEVPHQEVHSARRSSRAKWWKASSASTAAPPPPRPCCCRRITSAASLRRPTSSRRATRSRTRSRCCRSWTRRFAIRARR